MRLPLRVTVSVIHVSCLVDQKIIFLNHSCTWVRKSCLPSHVSLHLSFVPPTKNLFWLKLLSTFVLKVVYNSIWVKSTYFSTKILKILNQEVTKRTLQNLVDVGKQNGNINCEVQRWNRKNLCLTLFIPECVLCEVVINIIERLWHKKISSTFFISFCSERWCNFYFSRTCLKK